MNIYLDIDGVLLANDREPARYVKEFLEYVLGRFPDTTYWLTTHCMHADAREPLRNVGYLFDAETVELLKRIKPTAWNIAKTEAIDLTQPFLWFDDDLFLEERRTLEVYGALENHVLVDLAKSPSQLLVLIQDFPEALTPIAPH